MATTVGTSNLRQSSRQTRTNPARNSKTVGSHRQNSLLSTAASAPGPVNAPAEPHGFYPAITHFTDAITALPREYRRHTSLLKEVDAKAWAPEEALQLLLTECSLSEPLKPSGSSVAGSVAGTTGSAGYQLESAGSAASAGAGREFLLTVDAAKDVQRRHLFQALRLKLMEMTPTMDEKNHVLNNANEDMDRQMQRLDKIYPYVEYELTEEARLGSLTHWAYSENRVTSKEREGRSRKEAAAGLAIMADPDIATRSENRRIAMLANKKRAPPQIESEFEDMPPATTARRATGAAKVRRLGEVAAESGLGLGISSTQGSHRRKIRDKGPTSAANGMGTERALGPQPKSGTAMSREPSQQEAGRKRKATGATTTATAKKRSVRKWLNDRQSNNSHRININASPANSPKLASSPLASTFGKDARRTSPAPAQRSQSYRARQNSTLANEKNTASSGKAAANGNAPVSVSTPELRSVAAVTGKSADEIKSSMKETTNSKGDKLVEAEEPETESASDINQLRGGLLLERSASKSGRGEKLKREATADESSRPASSRASPRQIDPPARPERSARAKSSKTSTPVVTTFTESGTLNNGRTHHTASSRPSRTNSTATDSASTTTNPPLPPKRSHKKGAGLAAQLKKKEEAPEEEEIISGAEGEDEPTYCYCERVSYGEMVACDADDCPREWFHLSCVGLEKAPGKSGELTMFEYIGCAGLLISYCSEMVL